MNEFADTSQFHKCVLSTLCVWEGMTGPERHLCTSYTWKASGGRGQEATEERAGVSSPKAVSLENTVWKREPFKSQCQIALFPARGVLLPWLWVGAHPTGHAARKGT